MPTRDLFEQIRAYMPFIVLVGHMMTHTAVKYLVITGISGVMLLLSAIAFLEWDDTETLPQCPVPKDSSAAEINAYNACLGAVVRQSTEQNCRNGWNGYRSCGGPAK